LRVRYGLFLKQQGKLDDAAREFRSAIRLAPDNPFAHYNLSEVFVLQRKIQEAESELAMAIKADPRYAAPHFLLGRIRYAQKNYAQALSLYDQSLKLSIDASQRQELREAIEEAQTALARAHIEAAEKKKESRDYRGAWTIYSETLKNSPQSKELRDRILEFQSQHPVESDLSSLPPGLLKDVLNSQFWKSRQRAEELWRSSQRGEASSLFASALAGLDMETRKKIAGTAFNSRNESFGIHQLIHTWAMRRIEERDYRGALELMDSAMRQYIFGVIPPSIIDSLMIPPDNPEPKRIEEFDIEHHPERRAHEIFAAAYAGMGDLAKAREYLAPLESAYRDVVTRRTLAEVLRRERKLDEAALLLTQGLENSRPDTAEETLAAAYILAADILCEAGRCAEGRQLLEAGRARLPESKALREAREKR
jgi:tetratricopeptide (TPR) repeat protein